MPKIYDNIENFPVKGLNDTLEVSHRSDFCVGYFNLRGWKEVAAQIDHWDGGERNACRLLVGMQKAPGVFLTTNIETDYSDIGENSNTDE